jgi:hypothetical protein
VPQFGEHSLTRDGVPSGLARTLVLLLINALVRAGRALLLELLAHGAMQLLLEDGLGLDGLELGLEVFHVEGRRIASAAGIVEVVAHVLEFITFTAPGCRCVSDDVSRFGSMWLDSPIAFSAAVLFGFGRIGVGMAGFSKVAREPRLTLGSAFSDAGVVTVSELVGTSHCAGSEETRNIDEQCVGG